MARRCVLIGAILLWPLSGNGAPARSEPQAAATWKTFEHPTWRLALEYPADWSVDDDGEGVTFRSQGGTTIVLGRAATEARSEPAPGRASAKPQCTTTTTAHDVVATVCFEATSMSRRAVLILNARGDVQRRFALRTRGRDAQIFDAMVASVRPLSPPA